LAKARATSRSWPDGPGTAVSSRSRASSVLVMTLSSEIRVEVLGRVRELADLRLAEAEANQALGDLHADRHRVEQGDAGQPGQLGVVAAEAGAGQDDHLGPVLRHHLLDSRLELSEGLRAVRHALLHVHVDRADGGALGLEAV